MYDDKHNARGDYYETHVDLDELSYEKRQMNRHERRKEKVRSQRLKDRFKWNSPKDDEDNFN